MNNLKISLVSGDITKVRCDAIITAINSRRKWLGGIDGAIADVAGAYYHNQAAQGDLSDLKVVVALGNRNQHSGEFDNVIFVVDDVKSPLRQVIKKGLNAADDAGFKIVTIPAIRTGIMLGKVEKSIEEVVEEYMEGINAYISEKDDKNNLIQEIIFVIFNNPILENLLKSKISSYYCQYL